MFKSGKLISVADALSRSPLSDPNEPEFVNDNIAFIAIKDDRLHEIKSATEEMKPLWNWRQSSWMVGLHTKLLFHQLSHCIMITVITVTHSTGWNHTPRSLCHHFDFNAPWNKRESSCRTPGNQLLHQKSKRHGILAGCVKGNSPIRWILWYMRISAW